MSVAHAAAHFAESHAKLHGGEHHQLARGGPHDSSAELERVAYEPDHSALHAVVNVVLVATLPPFVGAIAVALPAFSLAVVSAPRVACSTLARPPGLSAPPPTSRAPPIG